MGAAAAARIKVDGTKVVDLYNGGFTYLDRSPGQTLITVDAFMNPAGEWRGTFRFEQDKEYHFLVTPNSNKVWATALFGIVGAVVTEGGPFNTYIIPEEMAYEQLKTMNYTPTSSLVTVAPNPHLCDVLQHYPLRASLHDHSV
jgi:hypothetical protein